ncbi:hypothetical protein BA6E_124298 [Bacteroidales bacterium 6E]|nr:hypothetical protein BA6E_124298 [Bacteroidales bacterium 6E]
MGRIHHTPFRVEQAFTGFTYNKPENFNLIV